jgi:3-oxochol-4-en-24-oyl-CoA dehydrogenase
VVATVTDEQFAARELVRDWARNTTSGPGGTAAIRADEQGWEKGEIDAWRPVFARFADLGIFGVAVAEEAGGAGGSIEDLCAIVEEAAKALVPGPVATTALASLVVSDPELLAELASGERFAGVALDADVEFDSAKAQASGTAAFVSGAAPGGVLVLSTRK